MTVGDTLIYMDNSATSFPKPKSVIKAVKKSLCSVGNPGRSSGYNYNIIYEARETLADFFNTSPEKIVFTHNATHALNIALKGLIDESMTVAYEGFAHNSVLRSLYEAEARGTILKKLRSDTIRDSVILSSFEKMLRHNKVDLLVLTHTSNVLGKELPVGKLGKICRDNGVVFVVDGSQGVGTSKIDLEKDNIDILASSGHKGMYGIMGSGFLAVKKGFNRQIRPLITGGSGIMSLLRTMPDELPERLEAGTLAVPSIISMKEGTEYINALGVEEISECERDLRYRLLSGMSVMRGVKIYNADINAKSIVLFNINSMTPPEVADKLFAEGVIVRQGYHCAPLVHEMISKNNTGYQGAVRLSVGYFNTKHECDKVLKKIYDISRGKI